ncbi:sensor histidine kinase [Bacillus cytotoxicus]|uniref:Sensor histidine kinase-, DNA gyrase B-, and HSP90-like ATPase family protein n=3 Tax=Bacillus cereus group TaxID=86661 RepID=A0AAX2CFT9_9BACI|nr:MULTISPECIES: GHKL domain-containing protein [Bacillus cereus group]EMA6343236.1 GHKL domain-containing protein [Bacillus cytotoxicus]QTR77638.1 GHKL domain-containing protein [Bacillus cytotoxicus]QTR82543.1 GHKL domain-containing protein [Bacillus cytotoxicus]QTR86281.1 GHKL domain-containing protein [Bacillus cytotoxicus]SCL89726.1 Sensor histidine kinase-, DNA gyrase B-, and HSP90-like ATPase family protein [Bacillus cytotoxicus]
MVTMLVVFLQYTCVIMNSKIITEIYCMSMKELFLTITCGLLVGISYLVLNIYASILMVISVFLIQYYFKRNIVETAIVASYAIIIFILSDHLATTIESFYTIINFDISQYTILIHIAMTYVIAILICKLVLYIKKYFKQKNPNDSKVGIFVGIMGVLTVFAYYTCIYLGNHLGNSIELIKLNFVFFILYLLISLTIFYVYSESLKKTYDAQQKVMEYENMQHYTNEIEKQYTEMRKFRHDYQNILSSLDSFIDEDDYDGLKTYYIEKIRTASEHINSNNFKLENLRRIKVKEIKSVLSAKLIKAQELNIDATFEANEDIDHIPVDSVILVRAIGILMDNAIDELKYLGYGNLWVGMIKDKSSLMVIIQNTCREDVPRVHKLKEQGFSTKGENRGLGLSNLSELIQQCPNVVSETIIKNRNFVQKLVITLEG